MTRFARRAARGDLEVRAWVPDDAQAVHDAIVESADHLRPWLPWVDGWLAQNEGAVASLAPLLAHNADGERLHAGVFLDGTLVGAVGIVDAPADDAVELGYWTRAGWTGQGIATRATALVLDIAFADPAVTRAVIVHDVGNAASAGPPRRLGFRHVRDEPSTRPPCPADSGVDRVWELTRAAWAATAVGRTPAP